MLPLKNATRSYSKQVINYFRYCLQAIGSPRLCTAEEKAIVYVSFYRIDESVRDTIRDFFRAAFYETSVAGTVRDLFAVHDAGHKFVHDGTAGHSYGTFYDGNVGFFCF